VTESNNLFQNTWLELHFSELKMQLTRNATDKKNRSLPCMFPFVFIICLSREQYRKKTIVKSFFWVWFFYIPTKIHLDALYWNTPRRCPKDCPQHAHFLGKFAYVLFCVKKIRPRTICFGILSRIPVWACFWMHYSETHLEGTAIECTQHAHLRR